MNPFALIMALIAWFGLFGSIARGDVWGVVFCLFGVIFFTPLPRSWTDKILPLKRRDTNDEERP